MQKLAISANSRFWSADWSRYRLTLWGVDGKKEKTLERRASWFPKIERAASLGSPERPPEPGLSAIVEDSSGLVWVFTKVPAPTWRDAWPRSGTRGELSISKIAHDKLFHTRIEVIDPVVGRVISRRTLDAFVVEALDGPRAAVFVLGRDGIPRLEIYQLQLKR
jgi:hypothetical protein